MPKISFAVLLIASCLVPGPGAMSASQQEPRFPWTASEHNETVALKYLWWSFKHDHSGGRFYYSVPDCDGAPWKIPFPEVHIHRPTINTADVATVRAIFAHDARVRVSDNNGIIRIQFGEIPMAILRTRIRKINFSLEDQYNAELAVLAIEHAPEVQLRMRELGIHTLNLPMNMLIEGPAPGRVHLPATMRSTTMDEALDVVATTFNGLVETGYCRNKRLMDNEFTGGTYFDDSEEGAK